jgi:23S rRNA (pseudouridine1915-N3)-methyltransferase
MQITALNLQKPSHMPTFVNMKITLLLVGKTAFPYINEGIAIYEKRLGHYVNYARVEIPELKNVQALSQEQIKEKEGELILKNIKNTDDVILLDERGSTFTSLEWASHLQKKMNYEGKDIVFVIGGAYGFSQKVYQRANSKMSLSKMTFSHQIIRVIFLEQLYRAFTIMKGEPYHHE